MFRPPSARSRDGGSFIRSPSTSEANNLLENCCMLKCLSLIVCLLGIFAPAAFATGVTVTSPANGSTVSGSVSFVASATTSCSKGVASMGIYTAPGVLAYVVNGASLNTSLNLSSGTYNTTVEEWDYCGGAATKAITVTVSSQSGLHLTSPTNNGTSTSPVNFSATATTSCSKGVASMGIYTAPNQLAYVGNGASLNQNLTLSAGTYNATVTEWDYCGGAKPPPPQGTGPRRTSFPPHSTHLPSTGRRAG